MSCITCLLSNTDNLIPQSNTFASDQATVIREILPRQLMFDQTCTVGLGNLLWKKPLFSLQPHEILVELSSVRIFHHQCDMSCCGEKVLVINLNIARKFQAIKVKKYIPLNI